MFQKRNKLHLSAVFLKLVLSRPLLLHGMYELLFSSASMFSPKGQTRPVFQFHQRKAGNDHGFRTV